MSDHAILTVEAHRTLRIRTERSAALGDAVMCCVTVPSEFRHVQEDYPILFRLDYERDRFSALAMFGFVDGENLFLGEDGWDARHQPLAIAIQPFLIGQVEEGSATRQVHIDMASPRIGGDDGILLFDEDGRPTPYLDTIAEQLGALDEGYQASGEFFAALRRHELLEPLTLEIALDDGSTNRLVGFHVVDEDKLQVLDPATLGELHDAGHLMPLFMAVASIGKLGALVERKNRRLRDG